MTQLFSVPLLECEGCILIGNTKHLMSYGTLPLSLHRHSPLRVSSGDTRPRHQGVAQRLSATYGTCVSYVLVMELIHKWNSYFSHYSQSLYSFSILINDNFSKALWSAYERFSRGILYSMFPSVRYSLRLILERGSLISFPLFSLPIFFSFEREPFDLITKPLWQSRCL